MTAQKWIMYGGLIALVFAAQSFLPDVKHNPIKPIVYYKDEKIIRELILKEPSVKDMMFSQPGWVYVSMYTKGERKDGFAEYICLTIQPHLLEDVYVKIVDHKDVLQNKGFTEIGLVKCKKNK